MRTPFACGTAAGAWQSDLSNAGAVYCRCSGPLACGCHRLGVAVRTGQSLITHARVVCVPVPGRPLRSMSGQHVIIPGVASRMPASAPTGIACVLIVPSAVVHAQAARPANLVHTEPFRGAAGYRSASSCLPCAAAEQCSSPPGAVSNACHCLLLYIAARKPGCLLTDDRRARVPRPGGPSLCRPSVRGCTPPMPSPCQTPQPLQGSEWGIRINPVSFGASVLLIWGFAVRPLLLSCGQTASWLARRFTLPRPPLGGRADAVAALPDRGVLHLACTQLWQTLHSVTDWMLSRGVSTDVAAVASSLWLYRNAAPLAADARASSPRSAQALPSGSVLLP